ncbi:MAG: hypothetical protein R3325_11135, partial [Thermoanaerobaculia bacterium]|nr:hypothetical protein [Thermoanaerobaculia bacterium]
MSIAFELTSHRQGREILAGLADAWPGAREERGRRRWVGYDTFDWRLWRAGLTLEVERRGERWRATVRE